MRAIDDQEFELHIRRQTADGVYPVAVFIPDEDRRAEGSFTPPFTAIEIDNALKWMEQGLFDTPEVKRFGTQLFQALITGPIKDIYNSSRQNITRPLRFRLIIDAPAVARIPWELLYDPDVATFLALASPFVRGVSLIEATRPIEATAPLRILLVDACPAGVLKIQNQIEADDIQQALSRLSRDGRVEIETLSHTTLERLQDRLREANNPVNSRQFHVLHFMGHGQHDSTMGRTVLLFEDDQGQIDEVDVETFVNILRPYDLKLVFLNACHSMEITALELTEGFAPSLLAIGIPAVIGMQVTVLDEVALKISRNFYAALADNRPVDAALMDARQLVRGTRLRRKADMGIPVCYLRTGTGQILDLQPTTKVLLTRETWRPWLRQQTTPRRLIASVLGLITLFSTWLGLYWGVVPFFAHEPSMNGDLNVAVAEFSGMDAQGHIIDSAVARGISESLYRTLDNELKSLNQEISSSDSPGDIQVRGPSQVGRIGGTTREERAQTAEALAHKINADVIIYGVLTSEAGTTSFLPEFYLANGERLPGAEELTGQYQFGSNIEIQADISRILVAGPELRGQLLTRTKALARFVIGLSYFATRSYDKAASEFKAAEQTSGWSDRDGKEILYQFLGHTALKRDDLAAAQTYYEHALTLNPGYARALLALGQVSFIRAVSRGCEPDRVDMAGLNEAIQYYERAIAVPDKPARADIQTKAAFATGLVHVCQGKAGVAGRWDEARSEFQKVIDDYTQGKNERVRELAAESHAELGLLLYLPVCGAPDAEQTYRRAVEQFQEAIGLSHDPDRLAIFHGYLGYLYELLRDDNSADTTYATAISLVTATPELRSRYEASRQRLQQGRLLSCK